MHATTSPVGAPRRPKLGPARAHDRAVADRAVYRPRRPTATPLYPIVQHHLETFLAHAVEADPLGDGVPFRVENDFRAYLRCGILAHGFARARCDGCGSERLIAFSCRGRGACPSCNTRRMVEVAAHLTDHVLPPLPVRQWVLSLPKRLRPFLYRERALPGAVLAVLLRAIRATLCRTTPDAPPDALLGALSFPHRFGSSLNPHFHFHLVIIDGLFSQANDGALRFHETTRLSAEEVERTERAVQRRVLRLFVRRGLIEDDAAADMLTWQAAGGFSINAAVRVEGHDRAGRERLIRYCARPPFALERLTIERARAPAHAADARADADVRRVLYRLPRAAPDGRTVLALSPTEFLDALAHLIPPPRVHRHRYHGVLAPHARLRPLLTEWARRAAPTQPALSEQPTPTPEFDMALAGPTPRPGRAPTATASPGATQPAAPSSQPSAIPANPQRFPLDVGAPSRPHLRSLPAAVLDLRRRTPHYRVPHSARARSRHPRPPRLPTRPPPLSPARSPPELAFDFDQHAPQSLHDQTPAFDPADPEPVPEFEFDQSRGA